MTHMLPGLLRRRSWWCRSHPPPPSHWPWPASPPGSSWSWTASNHPPGVRVSLIECIRLEAGDMCTRICEAEQIMTDGINKSQECGQTIINVFQLFYTIGETPKVWLSTILTFSLGIDSRVVSAEKGRVKRMINSLLTVFYSNKYQCWQNCCNYDNYNRCDQTKTRAIYQRGRLGKVGETLLFLLFGVLWFFVII